MTATPRRFRQVLRGDDSPVNVPLADVHHFFKRDSRDALTKLKSKVEAFKATDPDAPPRAMTLEDAKNIEAAANLRSRKSGESGAGGKAAFSHVYRG